MTTGRINQVAILNKTQRKRRPESRNTLRSYHTSGEPERE